LTNDELADGQSKGFVSHAQVSEVFKQSTHTDPGPGFPWKLFLEKVEKDRVARMATLSAIRSDQPDAAGDQPDTISSVAPGAQQDRMTPGSDT
jgi:N-acetyl-anhydromuramyl-L-alanine amidase AmpD